MDNTDSHINGSISLNISKIEARHIRDLFILNGLIIIFAGIEAFDMLFFFLLGLATIIGLIVFPNRPVLIVPFLILCIPIEISKSWIPIMVTTYSREGNVSVLISQDWQLPLLLYFG